MSNLVKLSNPRQVAEQAAEWIVALEEGLSQQQRKELQEWLEANPAHAQALVRLAEHWDEFDVLVELSETFPLAHRGRRPPRAFAFKAAVVAAIAVSIFATTAYVLTGRGKEPPGTAHVVARNPAPPRDDSAGGPNPGHLARWTYQTAVGKRLSGPLPDGSVLTLNTDTALDVEYSATQRLVTLNKGEAHFSVAHDPSRPFRVRAGSRIVQAVGTVFDVKLDTLADVQVTVSEGTVRVLNRAPATQVSVVAASARPELLVRAGEQAVIGEGGERVRRIEVSQLAASEAWQRGVLIYKGETLDAVIADVSRYTTVRISISDESIRSRRVAGIFRAGDVDGLLLALRESFGIEARRDGDVILLTAKR